MKDTLFIGAHTSAAGGVQNALYEGAKIGATTIQFFTSNQRQWKAKALEQATIDAWEKALKETGIKEIMSHDSYLINLGAPVEENLQKSRESFKQEIIRCQALNVSYLNFHPGSALDKDPSQCLDLIAESLLLLEEQIHKGSTRLVLENTAGQGSAVGWKFEELSYIIKKVEHKIPIGVCLDTCHLFAAGYDLRTAEAFDATFKEFDKVVGLKHLYGFHVNDSLKGLGSRVDRHASLGKGLIGMECFKLLMNDPRTKKIPKYLETPEGPDVWQQEIALLQSLVDAK